MSYVPIVPHTPAPPSPRARELGDRLARVIVDFEEQHPTLSRAEVRQAAELAVRSAGKGAEVGPLFATLIGLGVMAGVGFLVLGRAGVAPVLGDGPIPVVAVMIFIGIAAMMAILLRRAP